jgi:hypothetical protein
MLMKNSSDTIGDRTCDLPVCSAVPQRTAPLLAPFDHPVLTHIMAEKAMFKKKDAQANGAHYRRCKQTLFNTIRGALSVAHVRFDQLEDFDCGEHVAEGPKHKHHEDFLMYS